jgi:hypothetical protein
LKRSHIPPGRGRFAQIQQCNIQKASSEWLTIDLPHLQLIAVIVYAVIEWLKPGW